jgi:hypothetical protein
MSNENALSLGSIAKKPATRAVKQQLNMPFVIKQVVAPGPKPDPKNDYVMIYMVIDAFGYKKGDEVKLKLNDRSSAYEGRKHKPTEIWDLQIGKSKGQGGEMGEHAIVIAEDAQKQADGSISCRWVKVAQHTYSEQVDTEFMQLGLVTVNRMYDPNARNLYHSQSRDIHFPDQSVKIASDAEMTSLERFKASAVVFLTPRPELAGGKPHIKLRFLNSGGLNTPDFNVTRDLRLAWDKENKVTRTPEDSVDIWLDNNAELVPYIEGADTLASEQNIIVEMWPFWSYSTGQMELEREVELRDAMKADPTGFKQPTSEAYRSVKLTDEGSVSIAQGRGDNTWTEKQNGMVTQGMHVVRKNKKDEWFVDFSRTLDRYPRRLASTDELITPHLTAEAIKCFDDRAALRNETMWALKNEAKAENNEAPEQAQGGTQDFDGEPDPASGMTPRA